MGQKITKYYAETRILLNLWALDESEVSKSKFVPSSNSKAYQTALAQLDEDNALFARQKNKRVKVYSLTEVGKKRLAEGLIDPQFTFLAQVGAKTANAVLKWFRQQHEYAEIARANGNGKVSEIDSYEQFSEVFLNTYNQLNQDYNLDDLVPIYRLRREIGDQVSRSDFNEWLLEIQANDLVQLTGGEMPNVTQDQREDSLSIPGGGMRFYVKRL